MSRPELAHGSAVAADTAGPEPGSKTIPSAARPVGERLRPRFEIRCRACGFGGVVVRLPERCPICGGRAWETAVQGFRPWTHVGVPTSGDLDAA